MNEATLAALNAMESEAAIPREDVRAWMRDPDLETRGVVYRLTETAWGRIIPAIDAREQCDFMRKYLLECVEVDPEPDDHLFSGFEAAWEFARWLKHIHENGPAEAVRRAAAGLQALALRADRDTLNRVGAGALEHILEEPTLRPHFAHWQNDPRIAGIYGPALEWGKAHQSRGRTR